MQVGADRRRPHLVMLAASLGGFITMLDTSVVFIAVPSILKNLGGTIDEGFSIFNGYILAFGALLITAGRLGETFGARKLFVLGLGLSHSHRSPRGRPRPPISSWRRRPGTAAALIEPQAAVLSVASYDKDRIGAALGIFGAILGLSALVGPVIGGFLVTHGMWRWIFFLNVPLAVVAIVAALAFAPPVEPMRKPRLDLAGTGLLTTGMALVIFGLTEGHRFAWGAVWGAVRISHLFALGILLLLGFTASQRYVREPLLPRSLFRAPDVALMVVTAGGVDFAIQGIMVSFSLCFQRALGMTAFQAGLTFAPLAVAGGIAAPIAGRLVDRHGGRLVVGCGLLVFAMGAHISALVAQAYGSTATFVPSMVITGIGLSAVLSPVTATIMRSVGQERAGTASGVLNTSRQIGALLGTAALGAILQNRFSAKFVALLDGAHARTGDACADSVREGTARILAGGLEWTNECSSEARQVVGGLLSRSLTAALQWVTIAASIVLVACATGTVARFARKARKVAARTTA